MSNPWKSMSIEEARAYDSRKERGPGRHQVAIKRELLWELIQTHLPSNKDALILDLGGGTGVWALPIAKEGFRVVLVDISPGFLELAHQKASAAGLSNRIQTMELDISDLSRIKSGIASLTLALGDPLSYCQDPVEALLEIRRVTSPGGLLIGDVENRFRATDSRRMAEWADVRPVLFEGRAHWPSQPQTVVHLFSPLQLRSLLETAGWNVLGMFPSDLLASILRPDIQNHWETADGLAEAVNLERLLRNDPELVGFGAEIQFLARCSKA